MSELYSGLGLEEELECVFRRKIVVLGGQGAGKSSLANSFLGWRLGQDLDNPGPFSIGHGLEVGMLYYADEKEINLENKIFFLVFS